MGMGANKIWNANIDTVSHLSWFLGMKAPLQIASVSKWVCESVRKKFWNSSIPQGIIDNV